MSLPADSSCEGRVSLHFTQSGLSMPAAESVVDEKGSEYILAHTGPRELDRHSLGGCGSEFGLVPGHTTFSVRVWANIDFGALKTKSVRMNEDTACDEDGVDVSVGVDNDAVVGVGVNGQIVNLGVSLCVV